MQSSSSSKRTSNNAFTLIELLVVIAIIAILAAILFPVFAQAKVAAKGAASLSNTKQTSLASIMYSADVDDFQVIHAAMGDTTAPADSERPWSLLLLPYMKSGNLFQDPLTTPYINTALSTENNNVYYTEFAYIYQIHAPLVNYTVGGLTSIPSSQTALGAPANTVLMVTNHKNGDGGAPSWGYSGTGVGVRSATNAGTPWCDSIGYTVNPQSLNGPGMTSWGVGSYSGFTSTDVNSGARSGGVTARKSGQVAVTFADGHASFMALGRLAQGTNFNPTQANTATVINDTTKYMWDNL